MGTLYLVATPIGNLEDITLRAVRLLGEVSLIAAEDTRHTGRLLHHLGVGTPMVSYHAHNERGRRERLLVALAAGDVAVVSDAGTPGLSDPGHDLVTAAIAAGHLVVAVPGASALLAAVTSSGLVPGPFTFMGFLPRGAGEAARALAVVAGLPHPLVVYELPHRLAETLSRLLAALGDRPAAVARELTKLHEEVRRSLLSELLAYYRAQEPRGEFVLVIDGAPPVPPPGEAEAAFLLRSLLAAGMPPSQAAREAAHRTGLPRQALYDLLRRLGPSGDEGAGSGEP